MTERELFERCKALGINSPTFERGAWYKLGALLDDADAHAILVARLAAKVREKHKDAYVYWNPVGGWVSICNGGAKCAPTEIEAWLALAEKVCGKAEPKKPAPTPTIDAEFERDCQRAWSDVYAAAIAAGRGDDAIGLAEQAYNRYRARFGKGGCDENDRG